MEPKELKESVFSKNHVERTEMRQLVLTQTIGRGRPGAGGGRAGGGSLGDKRGHM